MSGDRRGKTNHLQVGQERFDCANNEEKFLKTYYGYDVETESQSLQWVSKSHTDPKQHANSVKCESAVYSFFRCECFVHNEFFTS